MAARDALQARLEQGIDQLGLRLPAGAVSRLLDYQGLLERWNATYNLTAVRDPAGMITRHLLDSLAILPYVHGASLADLGTGPGLPGIVLAIAAPGREILLVDSNGKKVRFLREAIRSLKLEGVRALQSRVEDVEGQYDCVTARAFASLADMLGWGGQLLAPDGIWLAMKGKRPDDELPGIPPGFTVRGTHELAVPGLPAERHLLVIGRTSARLVDSAGPGDALH
jgi:16S rRNA (guanine527-N7)-methyltransferase